MTADLLGGFGDTANNIENLGRAGYGYVGSKLGLLSPDELPELRDPKDAFLTSDWLAKNTPLEDTGSAEYTAGRLSSLLIPLLGGFAARAPKPKATAFDQLGALYPGDKSGIVAVHATDPQKLAVDPPFKSFLPNSSLTSEKTPAKLRNELYQPSFGLKKEDSNVGFGSMLLIPNPRRVDPRSSPSVVRASDFYSPRFRDSYAGGGFEMADKARYDPAFSRAADDLDQSERMLAYASSSGMDDNIKQEYKQKIARALADKKAAYEALRPNDSDVTRRYNDRFGSAYSKGGIYAESLGQGSTRDPGTKKFDPQTFHQLRMDLSPRFQSLEHYAKSPYGGAILTSDRDAPISNVRWLESLWDDRLNTFTDERGVSSLSGLPQEYKIKLLKKAAKGEMGDFYHYLGKNNVDINDLQSLAKDILQQLKTAPSDYGEIKRFGPMGINADNFVGAVNIGYPDQVPASVISGFGARKIPYYEMQGRSPAEITNKILDLQDSVFSRGAR